jgi:hypothetical protein
VSGAVNIFYDGRLRKIGEVKGDCFIKIVSFKKHLQQAIDSWGIDANCFNNLVKVKCNWIIVIDKDNNKRYKIDVQTAEAHGQYQHFPPHRAQLFIARNLFTVTDYEKRQVSSI